MAKPLYKVKTTMGTEDYHHFLYVSILRRNKKFVPTLIIIAAILSLIFSIGSQGVSWMRMGIIFASTVVIIFGAIIFFVEQHYKKRIKNDKTGSFNAWGEIEFFDNYLMVKNEVPKMQSRFEYDKLFEVLLSQAFIIFYFDAATATLIRRKDIPKEMAPDLIAFLQQTFGEKYRRI